MESQGNAPGMQSEARDWHSFFPELNIEPHRGQREVFDLATEETLGDRLICLPTGYGKTLAGAGYYVIHRERGFVNRCLWIVSSDELRRSLAPDPDKLTGQRDVTVAGRIRDWFGAPCKDAVAITGAVREYKMHRAGLAEIYVTTYQFLREQATFFAELLDDGGGQWQWLVIADEAHRLAKEWAEWLATRVQRVETLYMTATPLRTDRLPLKGVPSKTDETGQSTYDASVDVGWGEAIREEVIRKPHMHAQEWRMEFEDDNGKRVSLTTSELRELSKSEKFKSGEDFDAWMVKQNFRYVGQYVQRIFLEALNRLNEKRSQFSGPHQMIIFAMSCGHAKFITHLLNGSFKKSMGVEVDWIGVLRSEVENRRVLDRFKKGELLILVQVDKVGEGFDCPPASVAVFLNLIQSRTKILQQLGRILRRLFHLPFAYDTADVYADRAHEVCTVVAEMESSDDGDPYKEEAIGPSRSREGSLEKLPEWYEIEVEFISTTTYGPNGSPGYPPHILRVAQDLGYTPEQVLQVMNAVNGEQATGQQERAEGSEVERLVRYQESVDRASGRVIGHALKLAVQNGGLWDAKHLAGLVKKNLNARWKRDNMSHDEMLSQDFKRKYEWLRTIDNEMVDTGKVPAWLTSAW